MPTDIISLVLIEILKISPTIISRYPLVQDKLLFLILIPHIILMLFLIAFVKSTISRIIGPHLAIESVLMLTVYLYIIWSGWYGTILIPIFISSFQILLVIGIIFFVISMFVKPHTIKAIGGVTQEGFKMIAQKTIGKQKDIKKLRETIEDIDKKIKDLEIQLQQSPNPYLEMKLQELRSTKIDLERELKRLGG